MSHTRGVVAIAMTLAALLSTPGTASAQVGKKISVAKALTPGFIAKYPAFTTAVSAPVPTSYKSKKNFLKVTASYQATCNLGDKLSSSVFVNDYPMENGGSFPWENGDDDDAFEFVTKSYYLAPESKGGPEIAPGATVTLQLTSDLGTGCSISFLTMVIETAK